MFVDEEAIMPRSFLVKKTNYSHCPLKKRPVQIVKDESPEEVEKAMAVDMSEPENLSTKPEDLSLTAAHAAFTSKALTAPVSIVPKRVVKSERQEAASPTASASPLIHHPLVPSHYLSKTGGPLEPLNLNTPVDPHHHYTSSTSSWHRPTPSNHYPASHYLAAFNYAYPPASEIFHHHQYASSLYPASPVRSAPLLSHPLTHHHEQLSPYAPRESAHSPPHMPTLRAPVAVVAALPHRHPHPADIPKLYMPYQDHCGLSPTSSIASSSSRGAFHSLSPPPATPEDLSSPGSVSSGSSSAGSVGVGVGKKRVKDAGVPRYQCMDCSKSYSTYSGLSKHQQFHCVATAGSQAKKSFSCKYCEKVYVSLGALKMHIRTHTLPCKCKLCGKAFSRPWLLQGHIRTHTGEKPFSCQHCNRAFADRSNLRAHLQTHSDVKKYSCVTCSKTFSRMSLLTKHMDGGCPGTGGSPHMMHMDMGSHHHLAHSDSGDEGHHNIMYPSP